jgi:thiamine-monophosphate kinase
MNEYDLIRQIAAKFPRRNGVDAGLFGCDAELVQIGQETWGLTIDEFTPEEDRFTLNDPVTLGRNLAAATLSDLLAAGVEPRFFLSSLALPRTVTREFVDGLTSGLAGVLSEAGCLHCGGDLGTADPWRFTGFAMGPVTAPRPLTHRVPDEPQVLCVTGTLGDLNLAAFLGAPTPALELRLREAALIRRCGTACIDTSGGLLDAVWLLHQQSPGLRFAVDVAAVPLAEAARSFTVQAHVPPEALLLGGAGEYELLFALPVSHLPAIGQELTAAGMTVVGAVTEGTGEVVLRRGDRERRMAGPPPCPREATSAEEHAQAVIQMARELVL